MSIHINDAVSSVCSQRVPLTLCVVPNYDGPIMVIRCFVACCKIIIHYYIDDAYVTLVFLDLYFLKV